VAATDPGRAAVPQIGPSADAIRLSLERIKLPPGFKIDLYALVPGARQIAVGPRGDRLFVGTHGPRVWVVTSAGGARTASDVRPFAPALSLRIANGVCWTGDGNLIVVEQNRVLSVQAAESLGDGRQVTVAEVVPQGQLIPASEEAQNHSARVCRVGPDGMIYIALGEPFNVPPREKLALYDQWGIGGIVRVAPDGTRREVYARGIRNSVGMDFNPKDRTLWFTDNQTDGMGDDIPKGEINRATAPGQFFGYPYIVSETRITQYGYDKDPIPAGAVNPQVQTVAHAADLGIVFYTAEQFPARYRGGFFSAQHGSWNRTKPYGAQVMYTSLKADGTADKTEVFASGWLDEASGNYRGRPVDVAVMKDGSLLVSDDHAGALYRITYAP
jgi:glucose/arabinose dehydrogenase